MSLPKLLAWTPEHVMGIKGREVRAWRRIAGQSAARQAGHRLWAECGQLVRVFLGHETAFKIVVGTTRNNVGCHCSGCGKCVMIV
jgi:hypothetical protein